MDKIIKQMNEQGIIPCSDDEIKEIKILTNEITEVNVYE